MKLIIESKDLLDMLEGLDRGDYRFADMTDNGSCVTVYLDTYQEKAETSDKPCETFDFVKMNVPQCLESILKKDFGCKKPFLKRKKLVGVWHDGQRDYTTLSNKGAEAYEKLVEALYGLEVIGAVDDAGKIIEELDEIANSES